MNGSERLNVVSEYFERLQKDLTRRFPLADVGENRNNIFHNDYVSLDNKRRIVFFVDHRPERAVTRVTYVLPVSKEAAPLFGATNVIPDMRASFTRMELPPGVTAERFITGYVAANNLIGWHAQIAAATAAKNAAVAAIAKLGATPNRAELKQLQMLRKASNNDIIYWKDMRTRLYDAIYNSALYMTRTSSGHERSSEARRGMERLSTSAGTLPRGPVYIIPHRSQPRSSSSSSSSSQPSSSSSSGSRRMAARRTSSSGHTTSSGRVTSANAASVLSRRRSGRRHSSSQISSESIRRRFVSATRRRKRTSDPMPTNSDPA